MLKIPYSRPATENLLRKAYQQMLGGDFANATNTLSNLIRADRNNSAARRYLAYALLQRGQAKEALTQVNLVRDPIAFDLFLKGVALRMMGKPAMAADSFQEA